MRVFFEDGALKIKLPEETTERRRRFLYDIYHVMRDWDKTQSYTLVVQLESQYKYVIASAKRNGVELTQEVEDYFVYKIQKDKEDAERRVRESARKAVIERAESKQKNGCGFCEYLEYIQGHIEEVDGRKRYIHGRHYCKHAISPCRYRAEDVEYEFECYKESKAFHEPKAFIAPPYPCAGCIWLEQAQKAWEEINKEKEGR